MEPMKASLSTRSCREGRVGRGGGRGMSGGPKAYRG